MPRRRVNQVRTFGIEFEFNEDDMQMQDVCNEAVRLHSSRGFSYGCHGGRVPYSKWILKGEHCGSEFTTPILPVNNESFDEVRNIMNHIVGKKGRGITSSRNDSCGMHVHIDVSDLTKDQKLIVAAIFYQLEDEIFKITDKSRHDNEYCESFRKRMSEGLRYFDSDYGSSAIKPKSEIDAILEGHDIYYDITDDRPAFAAETGHGTIEFRYAASMWNTTNIINWVKLLIYIVEVAKRRTNKPVEKKYCRSCGHGHYDIKIPNNLVRFLNAYPVGHNRYVNSFRPVLAAWIPLRKRQVSRQRESRHCYF